MKDAIIENMVTGDRATAMLLSEEEVAIIERHRAHRWALHRDMMREVLQIAADYMTWLIDNQVACDGADFVNRFYCSRMGTERVRADVAYKIVSRLIKGAEGETKNIWSRHDETTYNEPTRSRAVNPSHL